MALVIACGLTAMWIRSRTATDSSDLPSDVRIANEIGSNEVKPDEGGDYGDTLEHFNKHIKPLVAGIGNAKGVTVFEGMHRQNSPSDAPANELMTTRTVKWHGFHFYETAIVVEEMDAAAFTALFGEPKTFSRYTGPKFCGGFHPNWCVQFDDGQNTYRVLLCFGCLEARLYGPANEVFSDFDKASFNKFIDLLEPLHKELPMRRREE